MRRRSVNETERPEQALTSAHSVPGAAMEARNAAEAKGAMIVVYRRSQHGRFEILLLHRTAGGPAYEGDWAWTPPTGQRESGEAIDACARRELREETGLDLTPYGATCGTEAWPVFIAEAATEARVTIAQEPEHDRFAWLSPEDALGRCRPDVVRQSLQAAVSVIEETISSAVALQQIHLPSGGRTGVVRAR